MHPVHFEGQNTIFGQGQKEYLPLPAFRDNDGVVVTCWRLTWRERLKILFTGRFYLLVQTFNQPLQPLRPGVENPIKFPEQ